MADFINTPQGQCFPTPDKCWIYTKAPRPSLGITSGMPGDEFNEKVTQHLSDIKKKIEECLPCDGTSKVATPITAMTLPLGTLDGKFKSNTYSSCIALLPREFTVKMVKGNDFSFYYDFKNIDNNLPANNTIEYVKLTVVSINTIVAQASGIAAGVNLTVKELPANAQLEMRVNTPCGQIIGRKVIPMVSNYQSQDLTYSVEYDIAAGPTVALETQGQFNVMMDSRISQVEATNDTKALIAISDCLPTDGKIGSTVQAMYNKMCEMLSTITSLTTRISKLEADKDVCCNELKAKISQLEQEIVILRNK